MSRKEIIQKAIHHWGSMQQQIVCMEECAELTQAISKMIRYPDKSTDNITEEIADVLICIEMLKEIYGISEEEIESVIDQKLERTRKRIKGERHE